MQTHVRVQGGQIQFDKPFIYINGKFYAYEGTEEGLKPLELPMQANIKWEGIETKD